MCLQIPRLHLLDTDTRTETKHGGRAILTEPGLPICGKGDTAPRTGDIIHGRYQKADASAKCYAGSYATNGQDIAETDFQPKLLMYGREKVRPTPQ